MSIVNTGYENVNKSYAIGTDKTKTEKTDSVNLSSEAQKYLEGLKQKYNNVDFIVANFSTDEEAQELMAQGTKEYNCVITPETLEKMATDENERAKFEGIIEKAIGELPVIKEKLGEDGEKVEQLGISVNAEGEVSYFALLKESLKPSEFVERAKENAAEKKAEEAKKEEKEEFEKRLVTASTIEELIAIIKGSCEKGDRFEASNQNDDALKIDRVEFTGNNAPVYEQYVPTVGTNTEKTPFDFKV